MVYALMSVHNRLEFTKECIQSLYNQKYKDLRIVVVDDGSTDNTSDFLINKYPEIKILYGDGNLFWSGAMRMGVEYILNDSKDSHDYVLLLNNDSIFSDKYIVNLVEASEKYNRIPVGTILKSNNTKKLLYNSHKMIQGKPTNQISQLHLDNDGISFDSDVIQTKGTLVPIEIFRNVGNFSKLFPHYAADYDYFFRVKNKGYKLAMHTKAITYTLNDDLNLSEKIRMKEKVSLYEFYKLFFTIRSSSNLYSTILLTILYAPLHMKFIGTAIRLLYPIYFLIKKVRYIK